MIVTNSNYAAQLDRIVNRLIETAELDVFEDYWDLYKETADISNVQGFFVRTAGEYDSISYCNAAIIGDGLLVDIEGDDDGESGSLTIRSLDSIAGLSIHTEALPGLPDSQGASLVVDTELAGESDYGPHWVAKTEEEEEHLLRFAKVLVQAMSNH